MRYKNNVGPQVRRRRYALGSSSVISLQSAAQINARISDLDKQVAISYLERTLAKLYRKQLIQ